MELIDTHCHLDVAEFDADRDEVLRNCKSLGITRLVVPAIESCSWDQVLKICGTDAGLYPALGLHPVFIERHNDNDLIDLSNYIRDHKPVAVGEIGLDFYIKDTNKEKQINYFSTQLDLAKDYQLPVIMHVRKAHDETLKLLRSKHIKGGIAHAFNGSLQQAQQYIDLGFKLGFGGMLTYERSSKLHQLAKVLPIDAIVLETDAPDMTVASHHGERNSPEYLPQCLQALSMIRDESPEKLAKQTTKNAIEVLNLP